MNITVLEEIVRRVFGEPEFRRQLQLAPQAALSDYRLSSTEMSLVCSWEKKLNADAIRIPGIPERGWWMG